VAVSRSDNNGFGPGRVKFLSQDFLKIGFGIGAYSAGRGAL